MINDLETLWGTEIAPINGFIFDNVKIAGEVIDDVGDFNLNKYVENLKFR